MEEKEEEEGEERSENKQGEVIQEWQLPEDVITHHILPWLPIKPLTRLKVVSKHWYSTLSSPNFILKHIKQPLISHPFPPVETLLIQSGNNFYLYSCDHDDNVVVKDQIFDEENNLIKLNNNDDVFDFGSDTVHLVGCSNGLVCLGESNHGKYFILWNPNTNQSHKYYPEYLKVCLNMCDDGPLIRWGFGYSTCLDDYYVVRNILPEGFWRCVLHVYSLKADTFKKLDIATHQFCADRPRLVDHTFYWLTGNKDIVAYDLVRDTVVTCPDLSYLSLLRPCPDFLCVMGGCLAMYTSGDSQDESELMIVDESTGGVDFFPWGLRWGDISDLIGYTKTGKIFVAHREPATLGLFDLRQSSEQSLIEFVTHDRIYIEPYVSSQVSPLPPVELPATSGQVA